jgi:hypothetical protein
LGIKHIITVQDVSAWTGGSAGFSFCTITIRNGGHTTWRPFEIRPPHHCWDCGGCEARPRIASGPGCRRSTQVLLLGKGLTLAMALAGSSCWLTGRDNTTVWAPSKQFSNCNCKSQVPAFDCGVTSRLLAADAGAEQCDCSSSGCRGCHGACRFG